MIGPFRGGRTVAISGVPGQPNVFYMAPNNGGVWKTTDFGQTWNPIFDDQPTGSDRSARRRALQSRHHLCRQRRRSAPPRSLRRRRHLQIDRRRAAPGSISGLRDAQQIGSILVDPKDPNRVFVAVLGHPYGPNPERGVFRSLDGGRPGRRFSTKTKTPARSISPSIRATPQNIYAGMWASRRPRGRLAAATNGPAAASTNPPTAATPGVNSPKACPSRRRPRPHRPRRRPQRSQPHVRAGCNAKKAGGVYRSDDAGESWQRVNTEERIYGRGDDFACVRVDPKDQDVIYVANTSTYRSDRRGQELHRHQGRSRRRRLPHHLDQSRESRHHRPGRRSGRDHQRQRRRRPGAPGTTSRPRSSITSSPTTSFPTGSTAGSRKAVGRHCQPQRLRRDHVSRLAPGRRRRVRLRRARSAASQS